MVERGVARRRTAPRVSTLASSQVAVFSAPSAALSAVIASGSGTAGPAGAAQTVAPQITTQPANLSASAGSTVTLSAAASGVPQPSVQWQVSRDGGVSWTAAAGSFTAVASENGYQYRAAFTNSGGSATTDAVTLTVVPESTDVWSGYIATGESYSAVNGSWTVPTVNCPSAESTLSFEWIGIDGWPSNTVEQDGTAADCFSGAPMYYAWYEMYGDAGLNNGYSIPLPPESYPVAPGDSMSASVRLSGSQWLFTLADATSGWTFSTAVPSPTPPPAQASAEWIVEDPDGCSPQCQALSSFGSVGFTGASAVGDGQTGPISSFPYTAVQIVQNSAVLAAPGPLDAAGNAFSDSWFAG